MTTIAERLRVYGQPDMRGEDSITWQAADALDAAEKALERADSHMRFLPPEYDEPGSVLADVRAALAKLRGAK